MLRYGTPERSVRFMRHSRGKYQESFGALTVEDALRGLLIHGSHLVKCTTSLFSTDSGVGSIFRSWGLESISP